jgi:hypothetical protein
MESAEAAIQCEGIASKSWVQSASEQSTQASWESSHRAPIA